MSGGAWERRRSPRAIRDQLRLADPLTDALPLALAPPRLTAADPFTSALLLAETDGAAFCARSAASRAALRVRLTVERAVFVARS